MEVILYTRRDCPLCDEAKVLLDELRETLPFELAVKDVHTDPKLMEMYGARVPLVVVNGREVVGYVFNRDRDVARPFIQMFAAGQDDVLTLAYADIRTIRFTGRDTAAGNSYAAWLRRREVAKASREDA